MNLFRVYQQLDEMQDELKSLERKKNQVKHKMEDLQKTLQRISSPSERLEELSSSYARFREDQILSRQEEEIEEMERQIAYTRKEWSDMCERERVLPKEIAKLKKILEKLEDPRTHEKRGYSHGYEVGYRNKEDCMQISVYSLLEPPENIVLQYEYKARNEIIRKCRQYYEDGYKRGKRIGKRDRKEIMGE